MRKKYFAASNVALVMLLGTVASSYGDVPPPPANQNLAIYDGVFNKLAESDCRVCHSENPPAGVPVNTTYLPDRHHALVDTTMPSPTAAPYGTPGEPYECLSCHLIEWNDATSSFELAQNFRDCLICHSQAI